MRTSTAAFLFLTFAPGITAQNPSLYRDESLGFSISPLALDLPAAGSFTVSAFSLPPRQGFTANVNLRLTLNTTLAAFDTQSDREFQAVGAEVISRRELEVSNRPAIETDYRMTFQGRQLRFLALAVEDGDRVFLLTATSLEGLFEDYEPEFRRVLASFTLD